MSEAEERQSLRVRVGERARWRCEYCCHQEAYSTDSFSIEHILPKVLSGTDDFENLAFSCQGCNNHKYVRTTAFDPETGQSVPLYNPRGDVWSEHFKFDNDFLHIAGVSPTGRATISLLQLNRTGLVNLRWALYLSGIHPPDDLLLDS